MRSEEILNSVREAGGNDRTVTLLSSNSAINFMFV